MTAARKWCKGFLGLNVVMSGPTLAHGIQNDANHCGAFALNMIDHAISSSKPLLASTGADLSRAQWFNRIIMYLRNMNPSMMSVTTAAPGPAKEAHGRMTLDFARQKALLVTISMQVLQICPHNCLLPLPHHAM